MVRDSQIPAAKYVPDLGVLVEDDLSVSRQCAAASAKGRRMVGFLGRQLPKLDNDEFLRVYKAFIRPLIEFSAAAWNPWLVRDIAELESVQRLATRRLTLLTGSYEERLRALKLTTLQERRERGDLIECFKILNGFYDIDPKEFFKPSSIDFTRGNAHRLFKQHTRLDVTKFFFSHRVVNAWNRLPDYVCEADSVNSFKNRLDKFQLSTRS